MLKGWGQQVPLGYLGQEAEKGVGEGLAGQCRLMGPGTEVRMGLVRGVCSSAPGPAHRRNGCTGCATLGPRAMTHLHWGPAVQCWECGFPAPVESQISHKVQERPLWGLNSLPQAIFYGCPTQEDQQGQDWERLADHESRALGQETPGQGHTASE